MRGERVVINGRFLGRPLTGVERYATEMLRALDRLISSGSHGTEDLSFVVAVPPGTQAPELANIPIRTVGRTQGYVWEQVELAVFAGRDLLVSLCNLAPVAGPRNLVCVHDAHVRLVPDNYSWAFRSAYNTLLPTIIRRSAGWVTVSNYSAAKLLELSIADHPPDAVVYNGADHAKLWDLSRSSLARSLLPSKYVLALGSRSRNKNLELTLELARVLEPHGISVVIAGGANERVFGSSSLHAPANARFLGRVSDDDLAFLLQHAICFVFPSLFEGYGLPPVEAMLLGCPVIASNTSAIPEVLGDAALLHSPYEVAPWVDAVVRLSCEPRLRDDLIRRGRERAARYTWANSAGQLLDLIESKAHPRRLAA